MMKRSTWMLMAVVALLLLCGGASASTLDLATGEVVPGEPTAVVAPAVPLEACMNFLTNQTSTIQTHTITICNNGTGTMDIDKIDADGGSTEERPDLDPGKCDTWTVELKPGESLHVDEPGTLQIH